MAIFLNISLLVFSLFANPAMAADSCQALGGNPQGDKCFYQNSFTSLLDSVSNYVREFDKTLDLHTHSLSYAEEVTLISQDAVLTCIENNLVLEGTVLYATLENSKKYEQCIFSSIYNLEKKYPVESKLCFDLVVGNPNVSLSFGAILVETNFKDGVFVFGKSLPACSFSIGSNNLEYDQALQYCSNLNGIDGGSTIPLKRMRAFSDCVGLELSSR